jgi:hypothetical protein
MDSIELDRTRFDSNDYVAVAVAVAGGDLPFLILYFLFFFFS